jgi:hypothetical protein
VTENEPKPEQKPEAKAAEQQPETFSREYVENLRSEAAGYRTRAKTADVLAQRLTTALAAATGRLADASDLPHSDDLLDDDGLVDEVKVEAAVADLLAAKPHLASRTPRGDVGQGAQPQADEVSLAGMLRAGAG